MANLFIKISKEEVVMLKKIVRALGFSTMTKWLHHWIWENKDKLDSREADVHNRKLEEAIEEIRIKPTPASSNEATGEKETLDK